jgi:hypothetical protein
VCFFPTLATGLIIVKEITKKSIEIVRERERESVRKREKKNLYYNYYSI